MTNAPKFCNLDTPYIDKMIVKYKKVTNGRVYYIKDDVVYFIHGLDDHFRSISFPLERFKEFVKKGHFIPLKQKKKEYIRGM